MTERTVTEYDPRRPRIPVQLAAAIDDARGKVSFNRWVVSRLADALGVELSEIMAAAVPRSRPKPAPKPKAAPKEAPVAPRGPPSLHRPRISPAKQAVFSRDDALQHVKEKHAKRRASQRRES